MITRTIESGPCPSCDGTGAGKYIKFSDGKPKEEGMKTCWLCRGEGKIKYITDIDDDWINCIGTTHE